jgi:hypothetical protein
MELKIQSIFSIFAEMIVTLWLCRPNTGANSSHGSLPAKECEIKMAFIIFSRQLWRKTWHQAANPAQAFYIISYGIWPFTAWYR